MEQLCNVQNNNNEENSQTYIAVECKRVGKGDFKGAVSDFSIFENKDFEKHTGSFFLTVPPDFQYQNEKNLLSQRGAFLHCNRW